MVERKSEQYVRQAKQAADDIAKLPQWMQNNLKPTTIKVEMQEPTFDADGYPTDETLEKIKKWEIKTFQDIRDAMEFIHKAWRYDAWEYTPDVEGKEFKGQPAQDIYVFSTYGWSGNESIVGALQTNDMLRMLGAWSWRRGGHYEYRFSRW